MFNKLDSDWERGLQPALSLACVGLCDTSRSLVNCQVREKDKTDELNRICASTRFWNAVVTDQRCGMILVFTHTLQIVSGPATCCYIEPDYIEPDYKTWSQLFLDKQMYLRICR